MIRSRTAGICATLVALITCAAAASAQRPDFSGVWKRVVDPATERPSVAAVGDAAFVRGDAGSGWGSESPITISQAPGKITVAYQVFSAYDLQPPLQLTFALDGSTSTNSLMIGHSATSLRSTTSWTDGDLLIITHYPGPPGSDGRPIDAQVTQSLRLESPTTLVIETTRRGILGAADATTRTTYTKQ